MSFESISNEQLITVSGGCPIHGTGPATSRIRGGAGLGGGAGRGGAGAAGAGADAGAAGGGCQSIIAALQNLLAQFGSGGLAGAGAGGAGAGASPAAGPAEETSARPRGGASAAGGCACGGGSESLVMDTQDTID